MARQAFFICAVAVALAACSSGGSQPTSALAPQAFHATARGMLPASLARGAAQFHPIHRKSWVAPDVAGAPRLLFISDFEAGVVDIFTMPALTLKGQLTGFTDPEGMCVDSNGAIWIANTGASELEQYSRSGTLLKTLSIPGEYPASCAVNNSNGDLAVGNIESTAGEAGSIMIFKNGSGSGSTYTNSSFYFYFFLGYDPNGNLFFDGTNSSRTSSYFAELPAGSSSTKLITLSGGTLYLAGFVQWYRPGNYIALGDQECGGTGASCVYWVTVSGSGGTITATTDLTNYEGGQVCDLVQGVVAAAGQKYLAGPDYESCGYTDSTVYRWPYEAGGSPTNYNDSESLEEPIGAAVSTKITKTSR
jgi:hypothetical protein